MSSSRRIRRSATFVVALLASAVVSLPALGVGVAGVELRVDLAPQADGRRVVVLADEVVDVGYSLENISPEDVTVRIYSAAANVSDTGAVAIDAAGTAPWLDMPDTEVTVPAGAQVPFTLSVDPRRLPDRDDDEGDVHSGAIVVESLDNGDTLVVRAAVVLTVVGEPVPFRSGPLVVAGVLVLLVTAGTVGREFRSRRGRPTSEPVELVGAVPGGLDGVQEGRADA